MTGNDTYAKILLVGLILLLVFVAYDMYQRADCVPSGELVPVNGTNEDCCSGMGLIVRDNNGAMIGLECADNE